MPLEILRGLKFTGDVVHQVYYIVLEDQPHGCIGFVGTLLTKMRPAARAATFGEVFQAIGKN